jgi:transposase
VEALRHRKGGGPKPRLSEEQLATLPDLLAQGAEHFGFRGDVWTQPRVAVLIQRVFGVSYHPRHVGRLLKRVKWSRQKPIERAAQRNEAAIEQWRTETWEEVKKKPNGKDIPSCS